jgi:ABC-type multidrug transport system fused ATPase/permease subunit
VDRIIVMHRGRIVEDGDHAELLARNGYYARLHRHQHEGQI